MADQAMERVLAFEEALAEVVRHAAAVPSPAQVEEVDLLEARGRVFAADVRAPRDQPPFDRSTRDGFAVRAADVNAGKALRVLGTVQAGNVWQGDAPGESEAVEVMTGAPMPLGTDAVLMVEHAVVRDVAISAEHGRVLRVGENVVPRGAEAKAGVMVLAAGQRVDAATMAVAASCGLARLKVWAKPTVAVVATGDELVELDAEPEAQQIYNSNSYALAAMVDADGGAARKLAVARDTMDDLRARLAEARTCDLVLLSGGVSMGKFDLVEQALSEAGAEFLFTGAKIQPGKPVVFGRLPREDGGWTYFFGLPGNPVSTQVCFHLFVTPMLRALCGRKDLMPQFAEATVREAIEGKRGLVRFLPAVMEGDFRGVTVRPVVWQGSGDVAGNAAATVYCVVEEQGLAVGDVARVLLR